MHSAKAEVETSVAPGISRAGSYVTRRDRIAPPSPRAIAVATSSHPSSSNIIAPDRITLPGFTLSCPAYLGAVPCVASNTAKPSPTLPPGASPSPPTWAAAASDSRSPFKLGAAIGTQRVLDRLRDQALGAELGHRLDADRAPGADLGREPLAEKSDDGIGLWAAGPVLDPGVHILDVLAENDHVELLRLAHRAGHALEVAHRPDARVQVEQLAQGDVEGSDSPSDGSGQRALDRHAVCPDGVQGSIGKPAPDLLEGFLARQHLEPINLALPAGHFPDGGVEHAPGGAPDVGPGAVALDEGDDGVARHHPTTVAVFDALAHGQAVYTARPGLRQAKRWPYT